jgi:hypothetical protein
LQGGKNKLGAAADHERRLQRLQEILDELVVLGPTGKSYEHASPRNLGWSPIFSLLLVLACSSHSLDPITFPQCSRLPADLAGMEGLLFGGFDALADGVVPIVHMDTQPAKFLLHLRPPATSNAATIIMAPKSSQSRHRMSNQPSS